VLYSTPRDVIELSPPDVDALGMYWRCVSLFRSLLILLDNHYPEEALFLARSLFEESLRLMQLNDAGTERERMLVGLRAKWLQSQEHLFATEAEDLGLTEDASDVRTHVRGQQGDLERYRKRKGIGGSKGLRDSVKDAAIRLDRQGAYWTYLLAHKMVHGEDTAQLYRRNKVEVDVVAFFSHTRDPDILAGVGAFAARCIADAFYAAAGIFGWAASSEVQELVEDVGRRVNDS
jgi:hypothetical protein